MSSRFVSAGGDEAPTSTNADWERAKQEVTSRRTARTVESSNQEGGKSLYEVLQANKAAKEDAFEEATRLRNQFRPLDDSEIEFLDSVRQSERTKEDQVKQETAEQLDQFRKSRIAAEQEAIDYDRKTDASDLPSTEVTWATSKKRRREKVDDIASSPKVRKASTSKHQLSESGTVIASNVAEKSPSSPPSLPKEPLTADNARDQRPQSVAKPTGLGLAAYESDED